MEKLRRSKQERMSLADRTNACISGQQIDRVPFFPFILGFAAKNVGYPIASIYNDAERSFWAQVWTQEQYGYDGYPQYRRILAKAWDWGGEVHFPSTEYEQGPTITRYAVESEEDVEKLELPDVKTAGLIPTMMAFSKLQEKFGLPITVSCGSPFTNATRICDPGTVCRWIIKKPELVHRLCRLATEHILNILQYWVDTFGAGRVVALDATGLESNDLLSPKQFEEFGLPYLKEVHEKGLAMGIKYWYTHFCGEQKLNMPYYAELPMGDPGIASISHQVDLTTAIKYLGDTCVIMGNIEPQVIQNLAPQQVYELCKQAILKGKHAPRGYMLMAGCELPPMAPPYNLYVMMRAVKDFGRYD